ncbi:unnamed protein product [Brassicogethes aeneus]|uniref:NADP-dependent oxidoreductase domain-containing protein n=1 Tax=Brassicogethes aeneus TaxID=1431903 RepID=A0A9P0B415_BRAAE|nr:unnamed protein product [Brassicogethes aeneus]
MGDLPETYVAGFHDVEAVRKMKYTMLGDTDIRVSKISFGTAVFSNLYSGSNEDQWKKTLCGALKSGVNYIDTAPWYGQGKSEETLGKLLEGVPRQAYYIATKVGRYEKDPKKMFDFSAKKVTEGFEESLRLLKLDYVDIIQIHDVEFAPNMDIILNETLPAVQAIVKSGKAKYLGITGYAVSTLADILAKSKVKIDTILSYSRFTVLDQSLNSYLPIFKSQNIGIINAAVNAMGLLSNYGPPDWHPATESLKKACAEAREYCKENNVELGKLAVYYSVNQKGPHTTLVGMNHISILKSNLDVLYNGLTDNEKQVFDYLQNNIFGKLENICNWEGVELAWYREELKK